MRPGPAALAALVLLGAGCAREPPAAAPTHRHEHHPPHGGTPVVLGDEAFHLELVLDPAAGVLQAYVLDGEMEGFVRSAAPAIEVVATVGGSARTLRLAAVANPATGETVGDTALFEAKADWLRGVREFDGVIPEVTVRGATFTGTKFNFPRGNDTGG